MKPSLDSRAYSNFILTVIAVLLLAVVTKGSNFSITPEAQAQTMYRSNAESAPANNIAKIEDTGVADATRDVASANREIAAAIREAGLQMKSIADALQGLAATSGAKAGTAASAVEVSPSN